MNKIYLVLSNLKHDGEAFTAGSLFEGAEASFAALVQAGVLRVIEGADSLEAAAEIVKKEVASGVAKAAAVAATKPKDTWAASKPEEKAPEAQTTETSTDGQQAGGTDQKDTQTDTTVKPEVPAVGTGDVAPAGTEL